MRKLVIAERINKIRKKRIGIGDRRRRKENEVEGKGKKTRQRKKKSFNTLLCNETDRECIEGLVEILSFSVFLGCLTDSVKFWGCLLNLLDFPSRE